MENFPPSFLIFFKLRTCTWRNSKRSFFLMSNDWNYRRIIRIIGGWFHFDTIRFKLNLEFLFFFFFNWRVYESRNYSCESVFLFLLEKYSNIFISYFISFFFYVEFSRIKYTLLHSRDYFIFRKNYQIIFAWQVSCYKFLF